MSDASRMITDAFMQGAETIDRLTNERDTLLARVKELEGELGATKIQLGKVLMSSVTREDFTAQLHQRDTALVAARVALEKCRRNIGSTKLFMTDYLRSKTHPGVSRLTSECGERIEEIDHALSQIQACEVKK